MFIKKSILEIIGCIKAIGVQQMIGKINNPHPGAKDYNIWKVKVLIQNTAGKGIPANSPGNNVETETVNVIIYF
ncbi:MAG: hypothetical protein HC905_16415 [Bacteroidales bacterium]|nr:hypothetical protein [Bacteroidales bacterium]